MTKRLITYFLFAVLGAFGLLLGLNLMGFGPALVSHERVRVILPPQRQAQPERPARRHAAPKPKVMAPAVLTPPVAPTAPETIINIYPQTPTPAPATPQPVPAPVPAPTPPSVQPPAPSKAPEAAMAPAPPARTVNVLSGNTFQLRVEILSGNGSWNGGARYGYGSAYGWTPGYVARVCEERPTGVICFDRWIGNPLPNH